jgi:ankyrin repeat protein
LSNDVAEYLLARLSDKQTFVGCRAVCVLFQRVLDSHTFAPMRVRLIPAESLWRACEKGRAEAVKWLIDVYAADPNTKKVYKAYSIRLACTNGHLGVAKWLADGFDGKFERKNGALDDVCEKGYLDVAKWLVATFDYGPDDVRYDRNSVLQVTCENGHLGVAKWLIKQFGHTAADVRDADAFYEACANGHTETAGWLVDEFELTIDDVRGDDDCAARSACENGHLETVQWIVNTYDLLEQHKYELCVTGPIHVHPQDNLDIKRIMGNCDAEDNIVYVRRYVAVMVDEGNLKWVPTSLSPGRQTKK